jgi:hypothetical protein
VSQADDVVDHWLVDAHGPLWTRTRGGGGAHRRRTLDRYGAQVLAAAAWGGGGRGSPHQQQKMMAGDGFRSAVMVNSSGIGCSSRSGS